MNFWDFLTGHYSPSAKVTDGRLVLSLPDAETPAVWIMDLNDAATSVMRLENDKQGFYVIKKHSGKAAAETVAVYRDRKAGERALTKATCALEKARELGLRKGIDGRPVIIRPASRLARAFNIFLFIWFVLHITGGDTLLYKIFFTSRLDQQAAAIGAVQRAQEGAAQQPQQQQQMAPAAPVTAKTTGVPMSADEFLKQTSGH